MKRHKAKRKGQGLTTRQFIGKSGKAYTVHLTPPGAYHVLVEVEAKSAARDCGGTGANTRAMWASIWDGDDDE